MTSENGPTRRLENKSPPSNASWIPPHSAILNEAASLINRGGLGSASQSKNISSTPSKPSTPLRQLEEVNVALDRYEKQFYPGQPKSLSGIAIRSFILGLVLSSALFLSAHLLSTHQAIWRIPFFLALLSLFHFLEFYTTSRANTSSATISSFLLTSNGSAYAIAHTASLLETAFLHLVCPAAILPPAIHNLTLALGIVLVVVGQGTRAAAMLTAGTNFSHVVRHTKAQSHELVTTGVYGVFRHPSYFGFFWWSVGTQLVCGNILCLAAFAGVLWKFFESRISGEEQLLVGFFGDEYVRYRQRTRVGIPFIK
ncbi:prenyl cysteine carboxyl methyltransferase Ste14 [Diplocarpon rosae]|nr:prenyl cysteine carboxyl methyltransferase Ste14 [Diplocarpon rosae]